MCNLGSIALPSFIRGKEYDFQKLHDVTKVVAFNLNRIIDVNYYPVPQAQRSNMRNRPVGIGVQGLADLFMALCARELNKKIWKGSLDVFNVLEYILLVGLGLEWKRCVNLAFSSRAYPPYFKIWA